MHIGGDLMLVSSEEGRERQGGKCQPGGGGLRLRRGIRSVGEGACAECDRLKVFVSFDYETDLTLKEDLISQAEQPDSPFSVTDFSLQERQPESTWLSKAQSAIARSDVFIVILGENTHNAPGVFKEINIAQGLKKRRFQLRPQGKKWNPMRGAGEMVVWTWPNLRRKLS